MVKRLTAAFFAAMLASAPAGAADDYDDYNAEDIMRTCAPCHGEFGQGGGGGEYPRIAGLHKDYIAEQLHLFKRRERENIPMFPYTTERELPDDDIRDISIYLSKIKLQTELPPLEGTMDGLERLLQAKMTLQIPRWPGDVDNGKALYDEFCKSCHGNKGQGRVKKPLVAGQWMPYMDKQIKDFLAGKRAHDDLDFLFGARTPQDLQDILAYISILDD